MNIELTTQQQRQLDNLLEQPPQVVDPRTKITYVLIKMDEYELLHALWEEEKVQQAIHRVALHNAVNYMNEDL
ncbi:MAG: hypothetical protein R3C14_35735 [Caldilineaceae bacterium]